MKIGPPADGEISFGLESGIITQLLRLEKE
jgi:hypothetical protein